MKRVVKEAEVRRLEIIAAAKKLFEKNGYENTSVETIIREAGIAKGTFYYYFKAKKDVLKALVKHIGLEMETHFISIVELKDLTAIDKLKLMIRGDKKKKISKSSVMEILHKPENRELQEQLNIQCVELIAPLIAKVLEQGKREGVFNAVPIESIQLILAGSQFILDSGLFNWTPKKRITFLKALQDMFELMLGAKAGSLSFISNE
jgi:AcrR family transcriptional regulator